MIHSINISEDIYFLGVNDRRTELFENIHPLPMGVSYNCYLINDTKTVLLDSINSSFGHDLVTTIEGLIEGRDLDYFVIHHLEPDHSSEIDSLLRRYPNIKIVGNKKSFSILKAYFGKEDNLVEVEDGDTMCFGKHTLKFIFTPWVHWPETMMSYHTTEGILFSGDAFGMFGALSGEVFDDQVDFSLYESEMRRYYSNVIGKYSGMVQKAIAKLSEIKIDIVAPIHGLVWRTDPQKVVSLYDRWSRFENNNGVVVAYGSMYGFTAAVADYIALGLVAKGVRNVRVFDVSKTQSSFIISDIWQSRCVVLGSCAYNGSMLPTMEALVNKLVHLNVKNKSWAIFGSYSWNGGGVRRLKSVAESASWEIVGDSVEILGQPDKEKLKACDELIDQIAKTLL